MWFLCVSTSPDSDDPPPPLFLLSNDMLLFDNIVQFAKGHILRIHSKDRSLQREIVKNEDITDIFYAPGEYLKAKVYLPYYMCLYPPKDFDYQFVDTNILKISHEKKTLSTTPIPTIRRSKLDLFRRKEPTALEVFSVEAPHTVETTPLAEGESHFSALMNILTDCTQNRNISIVKFFVDSQFCNPEEYGDPENVQKHIEPVLEKVQLTIPYLILSVAEANPSPFLENIYFQHLAVYSDFSVELTDKVLSCGFLYINAPVANIEALSKFNGFGLVLREDVESKVGHESVIEEIEKWKRNCSSRREIFGVIRKEVIKNMNHECFTDYQDVCAKYTYLFPGKEPIFLESMKIIPLDDTKSTALIVHSSSGYIGVYFVTTGWEKWESVLRLTQNTRE